MQFTNNTEKVMDDFSSDPKILTEKILNFLLQFLIRANLFKKYIFKLIYKLTLSLKSSLSSRVNESAFAITGMTFTT